MKKTYFLDDVRIGKRFRNGWNDMISSEKMKKMSEVTQGNIEWKKSPTTDNQLSFFSLKSQTFGLGQTSWADKFWGILGIFGRTISTHFGTVFHYVFNHYFYKKLQNTYLELGFEFEFEFGLQRIWNLAFVCP